MTSAKAWVGAITAAILAGLSALAVVVTGDATLATVTTGQWIAVIIAVLTTGSASFGLIYNTTNAPAVPAVTLKASADSYIAALSNGRSATDTTPVVGGE